MVKHHAKRHNMRGSKFENSAAYVTDTKVLQLQINEVNATETGINICFVHVPSFFLYVAMEASYFNYKHKSKCTVVNKVSSVMGRGDSWPATVPSVVPTGDCSQ